MRRGKIIEKWLWRREKRIGKIVKGDRQVDSKIDNERYEDKKNSSGEV